MKQILLVLVSIILAVAVTTQLVESRQAAQNASELAAQRATFALEKDQLEAALKKVRVSSRPTFVPETQALPSPVEPSAVAPAELLKRLQEIDPVTAAQVRTSRRLIHILEELASVGPSAIPTIREFLARNEEIDYATGQNRGWRDGVPDEFLIPPSLRFGLFDALKQIGGPEAEKLMADTMGTTGRGVELFWLARTLQTLNPNKYRDVALSSAHELLDHPPVANATNILDRNDHEHLLSVLTMYGDNSFVATAQSQLVQADGSVDRSNLRYLQRTLGKDAVTIAANLWNDPRLTDASKKEPLARLALTYAGADAQANDFYLRAINDSGMSKDQRRNLIEDLNQDGFSRGRVEAGDLSLIENRITLIEQNVSKTSDPVNVAAFKEAYKDLLKMRERIVNAQKSAQ